MKSIINKGTLGAALAASLAIASSAYATPGDGALHPMGEAVSPSQATEVITIGPDTKYVNVRDDDAVKFVDAQTGKSFAWDFDTPTWKNLELSKIAPAGFLAGKDVEVYVADPQEGD
jgi:hypothetical protein